MENFLFVIYKFIDNDGAGKYKIIYAFEKDGPSEILSELASSEFSEKEDMMLRIEDYLEESSILDSKVLAVNDLNIGLETCHAPEDFIKLFDTHGVTISAKEGPKKSILNRFF